MFKVQEMIGKALSKLLEWALQRDADKQFDKSKVKYFDGDNT